MLYLITGAVNLDHVVVTASFLHCELTVFLFAISKYLFEGR